MFKSEVVAPRSRRDVEREWDRLATDRDRDIALGFDLSFDKVLMPAVLELVPHVGNILDVGCGTGAGTIWLSRRAPRVIGVDPSRVSIEIARRKLSTNAVFECAWVEDYARRTTFVFDAVVANMVLMNMPDMRAGIAAIAQLTRNGGIFVCTLTHPWFWPTYWGYADADWFDYSNEIPIQTEFRISQRRTGLASTHVHRPLHSYFEAMTEAGLSIDKIVEPMPEPSLASAYRAEWKFPRFLALRAHRVELRTDDS
jgi:SAM-dependent methyltransferase